MSNIVHLSPQQMQQIEITAIQMAKRQEALVQARFMVAMSRPREMGKVRDRMVAACRRPAFAEEALYAVPRGKKKNDNGQWVENIVEGASIRFAEEAARCMGNLDCDDIVIADDEENLTLKVLAMDLEANVTHSETITISKTVERSKVFDNDEVVRTRTNSAGKTVYVRKATEQEMREKIASRRSRALRSCILRLLPGDLLAECEQVCRETMRNAARQQPAARRDKLVDAFAAIGVDRSAIAQKIGHALDTMTPDEYQQLRGWYQALRDEQAAPPPDQAPEPQPPNEDDIEPDWMSGKAADDPVQPRIGKHGETEWHEWRLDGDTWFGEYSHHGEPGTVGYSAAEITALLGGDRSALDEEQNMVADAAAWAFTSEKPTKGNARARAALRGKAR